MAQQLLDRADVVPVFEQMCGERVAECVAGFGVRIPALRGKYPLPSPCAVCVLVLSFKCFRQFNVAAPFLQILFEKHPHVIHVERDATGRGPVPKRHFTGEVVFSFRGKDRDEQDPLF